MSENSISTLRAKRATFTFKVDKSQSKLPKIVHFGEFKKPKANGQTVLPDRPTLKTQKLLENAKIGQFVRVFKNLKLRVNSDTRPVKNYW